MRLKSLALAASLIAITKAAVAAPEARRPDAENASGGLAGDVHLNVLGALIFGVTAGAEIGAHHWGLGARFRWIDSGLYARTQLPSNDQESLAFS